MPICTGCTEVPGGVDVTNPKCQDCRKKEAEQETQSLFDTLFLAQIRSAELAQERDNEREKEDFDRSR